MRSSIFVAIALLFLQSLSAQNGYKIKFKIQGYNEGTIQLAYHLGGKQYIHGAANRADDGSFTFEHATEELTPGMYMAVLSPDNVTFDLLITKEDQHFTITTSVDNLVKTTSFEGDADDNKLFFRYMRYLNEQKESAQGLDPEKDKTKLEDIDKAVRSYQNRLILDYPESFTASLVKANLPVDYSGLKDTTDVGRWQFTQEHFFDNIDFSDGRLVRTPFLEQRIEYFVDRLQIQHPDDIILAVDMVLGQMDPKSEVFKNFLIFFLNKYAKSDIVGMDAVYVHLALNYYAKGLAPWTETDQLNKIVDNANALEPLLIGKTAPNLALQTKDGYTVNLHDLNGEYTVVYFWKSNCENCKKTDPDLETFFQAYKDKGVKISAICTNTNYEAQDCWDYIEKKNYNEWIHLGNPNNDNDIWKAYNVTSTPMIYLLDRDKKILSKRISAKQLSEVMDNILGN